MCAPIFCEEQAAEAKAARPPAEGRRTNASPREPGTTKSDRSINMKFIDNVVCGEIHTLIGMPEIYRRKQVGKIHTRCTSLHTLVRMLCHWLLFALIVAATHYICDQGDQRIHRQVDACD
jgi:hypothetical protein